MAERLSRLNRFSSASKTVPACTRAERAEYRLEDLVHPSQIDGDPRLDRQALHP